jgi:hypothetical protein
MDLLSKYPRGLAVKAFSDVYYDTDDLVDLDPVVALMNSKGELIPRDEYTEDEYVELSKSETLVLQLNQ